MGLVDPTTFDGKEIALIYIAGRVSEGKRIEQILSEYAIDYAVDIEPFESRLLGILPIEREGVGFYVLVEHADLGRRVLRAARLLQGLVEDEGG